MSNPNMPSQPGNPGAQGPEFVMPQDFTVPELPAVGTPDKVLDGSRETGSYTTPDGVTNISEVTADGMKQTRISGMGSQHDLPETAAEHAARMRASQGDRPALISEVPLTDEQREAFAAKRAADAEARANEPITHGGYTGVRLSQMPGAVDALGRPTGPVISPPESQDS